MKQKLTTILLDQNIFCEFNDRYIDNRDLLEYLKIEKKKIYILKRNTDPKEIYIPTYIEGIINYNKYDIRIKSLDLIKRFITESKIKNIEELLIVTSDQELIKVFENTNIQLCLIYKNMNDYMEVKPTYEFKNIEKLKTLIYKK